MNNESDFIDLADAEFHTIYSAVVQQIRAAATEADAIETLYEFVKAEEEAVRRANERVLDRFNQYQQMKEMLRTAGLPYECKGEDENGVPLSNLGLYVNNETMLMLCFDDDGNLCKYFGCDWVR